MIKCIIIDDEPLAIKLLSNYVNEHENLLLAGDYLDPIRALHEIDSLEVDLIFLDVQMPQLSGIQFLKILNNRIPVILTTAYDEYALESYDFDVVDYLLKPISFDRFSKSIGKFITLKRSKTASSDSARLSNNHDDSIFIKSGHRVVRLQLDNIQYMESKGDYLYIYTEQDTIKTLENLKDIVSRLSTNFRRCHRSYIVNMDQVSYIENNRIVVNDTYIPISRAYISEIQSYINNKPDFD